MPRGRPVKVGILREDVTIKAFADKIVIDFSKLRLNQLSVLRGKDCEYYPDWGEASLYFMAELERELQHRHYGVGLFAQRSSMSYFVIEVRWDSLPDVDTVMETATRISKILSERDIATALSTGTVL